MATSKKQKSPLNLVLGQAVRTERQRKGEAEMPFGEKFGLTAPYLRGIEVGSFRFPSDQALALSKELGWNYEVLSVLVTASAVFDSGRSNGAHDPQKLLALASHAPEFEYLWPWCSMALEQNSPLLTEPLNEWRRLPSGVSEFRDAVANLGRHLSTGLRKKEPSGATGSAGPASTLSPFYLQSLSALNAAAHALQLTLSHTTPLLNYDGIKHFGTLYASQIKLAHAFISYAPSSAEFKAMAKHWKFLSNSFNPSLAVYTDTASSNLTNALNKAVEEGYIDQKLRRKCVKTFLRPVTFRSISYDVTQRQVLVDSPSAVQAGLVFCNAWVYELQMDDDHIYLAMLDNYQGKMKEKEVYGVSLHAAESERLLKLLLGK